MEFSNSNKNVKNLACFNAQSLAQNSVIEANFALWRCRLMFY